MNSASLHQAPELAAYQQEPAQLPSGSFGKQPYLRLGFERRGDRTALIDLARRAPLIVQQALYWDEELPDLPCVFIISNSGGIVQGDRIEMQFRVGRDGMAHVTTQSATKVHEMDANYASQIHEIVVEEGAYLEYLPDPVIPHRGSRFITHTRLEVAPTATLLYSEILMAGRKHYGAGELFEFDLYSATIQAERPGGRELFTEKLIIEPRERPVRQAGVMHNFDVFGNVVLLTPKEHADRIAAQVPAVIHPAEGWAAGVSRLPNDAGLIYKVLGRETAVVRAKVREFWGLVRPEITGAQIPAEFAWR